ncbi:MAG: hypothetical protein B7X85_06550 [Thiotrichales bacterium 17-46-47]|nr:MAG: hypothetical protein B7X85_06550 [Thiotrichales bacterium 17-46-47]
MMGWMDTHCHLCLLKPEQGSVSDVVSRLASAGVHRILDVATGKDNWQCVADNAANFDVVYAGIGIHPTSEMQEAEADWQLLESLVKLPKVLAVGECGLDFYHAPESECAHQYARFERQIHLAQQVNKPLIIHTRNSSQQTLDVLKSVGAGKATGIMHCFVEDKATAQQALDIGFYLSFSGIATFKNATQVQEGKLNEPAYVAKVGEQMAKLKGISVESLAEQLEHNAQRLFKF